MRREAEKSPKESSGMLSDLMRGIEFSCNFKAIKMPMSITEREYSVATSDVV
jgi:hypothetical protein